ncbi:MAG: hypothetical protein HRT88_18930, partial [Lentisphaeraceae bacterium]|nr:hypothetical protein [Lentisphaeraceae bacterium]
PEVLKLAKSSDKWLSLRALWILHKLSKKGIAECEKFALSQNQEMRLVAYRALRHSGQNIQSLASKIVKDSDSRVLREIAASLRDISYQESRKILASLYQRYDGQDQALLYSIGIAATTKKNEFWSELKNSSITKDEKFNKFTRELHPEAAITYLKQQVMNKKIPLEKRTYAAQTLVYVESKSAPLSLLDLWKSTTGELKDFIFKWCFMRIDGDWAKWNLRDTFESAGLIPQKAKIVASKVEIPKERNVPPMRAILKLQGDASKGRLVAQRCKMCHIIEHHGVNYGPGLDGWGPNQSKVDILTAIWDPNATIAHGFSGKTYVLNGGGKVDGIEISQSKYYFKVKSAGGLIQNIPKKLLKKVGKARSGLMFYPETLGLTKGQDFANLVEYLHQLKK